jgi:hypothetical protein
VAGQYDSLRGAGDICQHLVGVEDPRTLYCGSVRRASTPGLRGSIPAADPEVPPVTAQPGHALGQGCED